MNFNQYKNFLFGMFVTNYSTESNANISSADIRLFLRLRHSKLLSLNALARSYSSSMIIMLLDKSKSFNILFVLITSAMFKAASLENLLLDKWHTLNDLLDFKAYAMAFPPSSPNLLLLILSSFRFSITAKQSISASDTSFLISF